MTAPPLLDPPPHPRLARIDASATTFGVGAVLAHHAQRGCTPES